MQDLYHQQYQALIIGIGFWGPFFFIVFFGTPKIALIIYLGPLHETLNPEP